jgi:molecular chaperone GrpE
MIKTKLEDVLKNYGLTKINVEINKPFDPSIAEAVLQVENDDLAGMVLEEIEAGYKLHNKVIRPARVKVAVNSKK